MYALENDEIKYLLEEYDISKKALNIISKSLSNLTFIKTRGEYLILCEVACFRYQSSKIDNEYLHSTAQKGYRINIEDVIISALNEVYEEPTDMSYQDQEELKIYKKSLQNQIKRHI